MQISTKITTKNIDVREDFWNEREKLLEAEVVRAIKHVLDRHAASEHFELNYDIVVSYPVETPNVSVMVDWDSIADVIYQANPHRQILGIKLLRDEWKRRHPEDRMLLTAFRDMWVDARRRATGD